MSDGQDASQPRDTAALSTEVWLLMSDLVLAKQRRREVVDAAGISFARTRALRRLARRSMSMTELAQSLEIDKPNATTVVDELEALGLVRRTQHPTDRRAKVVETTAKGNEVAARADEILGTPPPAIRELGRERLTTLREILTQATDADRE
jgi:DNA-binding MarR family transcriptional regulator